MELTQTDLSQIVERIWSSILDMEIEPVKGVPILYLSSGLWFAFTVISVRSLRERVAYEFSIGNQTLEKR